MKRPLHQNKAAGKMAPEIFRVIGFIVASNLPFWFLANHYFLPRPLINSDVFLALFASMIGPSFGTGILLLTWVLEQIQSFSLAYHFASPVEFLNSVQFASQIDWRDFFSITLIGTLLAFFLVLIAVWQGLKLWKPRLMPVIIVFALLTAADIYNGSGLSEWVGRDGFKVSANISGSSSFNLIAIAINSKKNSERPMRKLSAEYSPDIVDWAQRTRGNVLVVIVESMGQHVDPIVNQWLLKQLEKEFLQPRWKISNDTVAFEGSTTAGELRILCKLSGHYTRLTPELATDCLPRKMQELGYDTYGLHGFTGRMFDRIKWWPMLGLADRQFADDMPNNAPRCGGAFRGICDFFIIDEALKKLDGNKKFVYALTLNTHMPLEPIAITPELADLCKTQKLDKNVCQLTGQLGALLDHIGSKLNRITKPTLVMIVGDHAPPYVDRANREKYHPKLVPSYILTPFKN